MPLKARKHRATSSTKTRLGLDALPSAPAFAGNSCLPAMDRGSDAAGRTADTLLLSGCSGANLDGFLHASEGLAVPFSPQVFDTDSMKGRVRCKKTSKGQAKRNRRVSELAEPLTLDPSSITAAQAAPRGICRLSKTWTNAGEKHRTSAMFPTACAKVTKAHGQSGCKVLVAGQASHIIEVFLAGTSVKPRLQGFPKVLVRPDGIRLSRHEPSTGPSSLS